MEKTVKLYASETDTIKVSIDAVLQENGNLLIDGYDIGKFVEEHMGDSDYEYQASIPKEEMPKLTKALNVINALQVLDALAQRFNDNYCFSNILKFLEEHHIKFTTFYWR